MFLKYSMFLHITGLIVIAFVPYRAIALPTFINLELSPISSRKSTLSKKESGIVLLGISDFITKKNSARRSDFNTSLYHLVNYVNHENSIIDELPILMVDSGIKLKAIQKPTISKLNMPTLKAYVDLSRQIMMVFGKGNILYTWQISSGRRGHETPTGTYKPTWMARRWRSRQYHGAPMPYSVFFNRGIATHGTTAVRRLGKPDSHGCIRLQTSHARIFYNLVKLHGKHKTRIIIIENTQHNSNKNRAERNQN